MTSFIEKLPKVELHMHIEGSLEPELMMTLAEKNGVALPYKNLDEIKAAYQFKDLTDFVNLYLQGTEVIRSAEDFHTLTVAYLKKCQQQNVQHAEVFCDIRTYTDRGFAPDMVIEGIASGFKTGYEELGITGGMIPCFIRHLGLDAAKEDWALLKRFKNDILGIGLAAVEVPFPPSMFSDLFKEVRDEGLKILAHAGEEGDASYIWSAIKDLKVDRIDHGISCLDDPDLVEYLQKHQTPLTVCPCSNTSLHVVKEMKDHPIRQMLDLGLNVTINSDDPAHFGAYLQENMQAVHDECGVSESELVQMTADAIAASFADDARKTELNNKLSSFV
ncbi:adenosine deaminase [Marinicella rhabdoformis]|uniref:adenosine deaminase n=1 Tax=Marinicella rhabdoformis TaxID=2580566 RepID=UPI0012AED916|nr:adenosine deaminase [Marinicella rhabdoformis]